MKQTKQNYLIQHLKKLQLLGFEYIKPITQDQLEESIIHFPKNEQLLSSHVANCNLCELAKTKENSAMVNYGQPHNKIYVVATNSKQMGKEQLDTLKSMIEKVINIPFEEVYLTHLIQCHSPIQSQAQLTSSIDICKDYLDAKLKIHHPKLIITLGDAFGYLTNFEQKLFEVSGNLFKYNTIDLIGVQHPYYLQKNPSYKQRTFEDLKKIKHHLENI